MSKQRNEVKSSGRRNKNNHEPFTSPSNGNYLILPLVYCIESLILRISHLIVICFVSGHFGSPKDETIEIEVPEAPLLSDSNISVITLDASTNDSINSSSLSDTISVDSNTSAPFESLIVVDSGDKGT